jgi:cation diffusion facilitator CzcD-associated flavoprotein CzcO
MAIALKRAGIDSFTIYESGSDVGGTWRDNTYPGCACDVRSHLYSYSFEPKADWSRDYAPQTEIFAYLRHCADKYGLRPHLRLNTEIVAAELDEAHGLWRLRVKSDGAGQGEVLTAQVVIAGAGPLRQPKLPRFVGQERFAKPIFHSARWNHDLDLRGKTVASVGTGASAIQYVPEIAKRAKRVYVFQRTPAWILPRLDGAFSDATKARFARFPSLRRGLRNALYWRAEVRGAGFTLDERVLHIAEREARAHLRANVPDRALRRALTPDYAFGCKRVLFSDDFYPTISQPNVELVTTPIESLGVGSIVTTDGRVREVDALVCGTGFEVGRSLLGGAVRGVRGRELDEAWRDGVEAYFGMMVSGFPNFYLLLGPNTGLGHTSMVFMIEAQTHWIVRAIERMQRERLKLLDVLPLAQRVHNDWLQSRLVKTVWNTGCVSWYLDERGRNFALWPGFTFEYWLRTRKLVDRDFHVVAQEN